VVVQHKIRVNSNKSECIAWHLHDDESESQRAENGKRRHLCWANANAQSLTFWFDKLITYIRSRPSSS
jgi:hypothetical protein